LVSSRPSQWVVVDVAIMGEGVSGPKEPGRVGRYLVLGFFGLLAFLRLIGVVVDAGNGRLLRVVADLLFASAVCGLIYSMLKRDLGFPKRMVGLGVVAILLGGSLILTVFGTKHASSKGILLAAGIAASACGAWILLLTLVTFRPSRRLPETLRVEVESRASAGPGRQTRLVVLVLRGRRRISNVRVVSGGYILRTRGLPRFDAREVEAVEPEPLNDS
jgi:hypothetical protein